MTHSSLRPLIVPALFLAALMALSSCGSSKTGSRRGTAIHSNPAVVTTTSSPGNLTARIVALNDAYSPWTDVKLPVTLRLYSPASVSVSGTATMVRDRNIHLSFRFLGMEVMSVFVTPDSVFAAYKMGKIYLAESVKALLHDFPVTVGNVQDLLLGRAFKAGLDSITATAVTVADTSGGGYLLQMPPVASIGYSFAIDAAGSVTSLIVSPPGREPITCSYGADLATPVGPVAPDASVKTLAGKTTIDATLEWNLRKAEWNTGASRSWSRPRGYRRVTPAELLSGFSVL